MEPFTIVRQDSTPRLLPGAPRLCPGNGHSYPSVASACFVAFPASKVAGITSLNPDSYFLRFPNKPDSRIIALPAYLGGNTDVAGTKWISIFPENIDESIPRASAALLMNDYRTGYPFACMEAAQISAARTAASAVLAAEVLLGSRRGRLAVVGAGIISRNILEFFAAGRLAMDAHVQPARILLCGSDDGQGLRAL
ncbi:hypothetical protein [Streptomonospora salina]|uniref:hypothetical protein n=1 Tax=Streptomonospora salina TaxID=104205 RepID=UPI0031E9F4AA